MKNAGGIKCAWIKSKDVRKMSQCCRCYAETQVRATYDNIVLIFFLKKIWHGQNLAGKFQRGHFGCFWAVWFQIWSPFLLKKLDHLLSKLLSLDVRNCRWMTKAVRMIREMRSSNGSMIPSESGLLRCCSEGKPQKTCHDLTLKPFRSKAFPLSKAFPTQYPFH